MVVNPYLGFESLRLRQLFLGLLAYLAAGFSSPTASPTYWALQRFDTLRSHECPVGGAAAESAPVSSLKHAFPSERPQRGV